MLMDTFYLLLIMLFNLVVASALGYWLSTKEVLPFKPFNCWGCLSFWFSIIIGVCVAIAGYAFFGWLDVLAILYSLASVAVGLINYGLITKLFINVTD